MRIRRLLSGASKANPGHCAPTLLTAKVLPPAAHSELVTGLAAVVRGGPRSNSSQRTFPFSRLELSAVMERTADHHGPGAAACRVGFRAGISCPLAVPSLSRESSEAGSQARFSARSGPVFRLSSPAVHGGRRLVRPRRSLPAALCAPTDVVRGQPGCNRFASRAHAPNPAWAPCPARADWR